DRLGELELHALRPSKVQDRKRVARRLVDELVVLDAFREILLGNPRATLGELARLVVVAEFYGDRAHMLLDYAPPGFDVRGSATGELTEEAVSGFGKQLA